MTLLTRRTLGASALAALFATSFAAAQAPETVRVRATIEKVDGLTLDTKARDGAALKIKLADNAPIRQVVKASLADIKEGSFIAVTGMPQSDGSQKAVAILIFPEALRGTGEGYRPWDLMPDSKMTNATVGSEVVSSDGKTLVLKYKDGEQKVAVLPSTEITAYAPATIADVKPGEKIFIPAAKKLPDGTLEAPQLAFGDYGVWR
jgi:hypothetical protein